MRTMRGMTPVKDRLARRLAVVALVASAGGYLLGTATADPLDPATQADVAVLRLQVNQLQTLVLNEQFKSAGDHVRIDALADRRTVDECLVISRRKFIRQHRHGELRLMPVVAWDRDAAGC